MKTRGFTLIELMITIAIAAILLSAGLPAFRDFIRDNRMQTAASSFFADMAAARAEAARTYRTAAVCPSTAGTACDATDWNGGRIVYVDANENGGAEASEIVRWSEPIESGPSAVASGFADRIAFRPTGAAVVPGSVRLCDSRSGDHGRFVEVNGAGRVAVRTATCP